MQGTEKSVKTKKKTCFLIKFHNKICEMAARRCQIVGLLFRNSMKRTCGQSGGRNLTNFRPVNFESSQKKCFHTGKSGAQAKVQEVGQFEPIKIEGNYI